jgi:hypothetical protein
MQLHNDFLRGWEGRQYDTKLGLKQQREVCWQ